MNHTTHHLAAAVLLLAGCDRARSIAAPASPAADVTDVTVESTPANGGRASLDTRPPYWRSPPHNGYSTTRDLRQAGAPALAWLAEIGFADRGDYQRAGEK